MARLARVEVFAADEFAIVDVMNRTVRRYFLLEDVVCHRRKTCRLTGNESVAMVVTVPESVSTSVLRQNGYPYTDDSVS